MTQQDLLLVPALKLLEDIRAVNKRCEADIAAVLKAVGKLAESTKAKDPIIVRAALDKLRAKVLDIRAYNEEALKRRRFIVNAIQHRLASTFSSSSTSSITAAGSDESKRVRVENRRVEFDLIMNHFLRSGFVNAASALVREAKLHSGYQIEIEAITEMKRISGALVGGDVAPALAWCAENRSALKKIGSRLELDLLIRQFLLLVESKDLLGAVAFARKNMSANASDRQTQRAMATLAYSDPIDQTPYADLVSPASWLQLAHRLENEVKRNLGFAAHSPFEVALRLGLAVCKTHLCGLDSVEGKKRRCPCCQPFLANIAQHLPKNKLERSWLICRITGEATEDVLVLPNGQCYSRAGLELLSKQRPDRRIVCPITHDIFTLDECRKAFVL